MKPSSNKNLAVGGITFLATVFVIIVAKFSDEKSHSYVFWPKFVLKENVAKEKYPDGYITEKISQTRQNHTDFISDVYLTHHRYLLEKIAQIEIIFRQKRYTLNDVCYKPHKAIFETKNNKKKPHYIERLFLEMERLSPCLIVTPLNCFYDSYPIHSQISRWNQNTDYLNRRLRNAYLEALNEGEPRVYVRGNHGPDLIEKWAVHMFNLTTTDGEEGLSAWSKSVKRWIQSITPRRRTCANPKRSCDYAVDVENFFNSCMVMQRINESERRRQFSLDDAEEKFTKDIDCVDDREKFNEWMQERVLRGIMKAGASASQDHREMVNQRCDGIFHDRGSEGIEFFDEVRSFDSIRTEITLNTPANILEFMKNVDFVNGHESIWTLERSEELLEEFRFALRDEVHKFNDHLTSKKIGVTSQVLTHFAENGTEAKQFSLCFVLFAAFLLIIMLSFFGWTTNLIRSLAYLLLCFFFTAALYIWLWNCDGVLVLDGKLLYDLVVLIVLSSCLTFRNSLLRARLERCIQKWNPFDNTSNFSSLNTVGSFQSNPRRLWYVLDKYTNFQTAQDIDSYESFEKMPKRWCPLAALLLATLFIYRIFIDPTVDRFLVTVAPTVLIFTLDEYLLREKFRKDRIKVKQELKKLFEETGCIMSSESLEDLFARGGVPRETGKAKQINKIRLHEVAEKNRGSVTKKSKLTLQPLSSSTYDVSRFMIYPNTVVRRIRLFAVHCYFQLLSIEGVLAYGIVFSAFLTSFLAIGVLITPIPRVTDHINNMERDDLFVDFKISNFSRNWDTDRQFLSNFISDLDSISILRTISSWEKSFERFEKRMIQNDSVSSASKFAEWKEHEPISWAITAPRTSPSYSNRLPDPFQFRLRFELENLRDESLMKAKVQQLDDVIAKYSPDNSIEAAGLVYEHYHQNAVAWNSFSQDVLSAAVGQFAVVVFICLLFVSNPTFWSIVLFSFFFASTRLVTAAFLSLFSLDHTLLYTNIASIVAFLAAWTPFCELCRFRSRILCNEKNRTRPEQRTGRRIRVPFIAFVDNIQFFGVSIAVCTVLAATCAVVPQFNDYLLPTVILLGIQICSILFAIALSIGTRQMFETKVHQALRRDLAGNSTVIKVHDLTHKQAMTPPYSPPEFELKLIEQTEPESMFWAPPPKFQKDPKSSAESETEENDDEDSRPGPSTSSSQARRPRDDPETTERPPETKRKRRPVLGMQLPSSRLLADEPWHYTLCGAPFDATVSYENVEAAEEFYASGNHEQRPRNEEEAGRAVSRKKSSSSEEDVMSRGDPDEEVLANQEALRERWRLAKEADDHNVPGPSDVQASNRTTNADDSQPGPSNRRNVESDDDGPVGLNATPSPPRVAAVPQAAPAPRLAVIEEPRRAQNIPRMVQRAQPRDPLREPPIMVEFIQEYDRPNLPRHPRAHQYPHHWSHAMVAYAEDPFWTERVVPLPPGVRVPPRPYDYWDIREMTPPPEDFDWIPPQEPPPIPIPPEAYALFEERRAEHLRQVEEQHRQNEADPDV